MTTLPPLYQKILLDASQVPAAIAKTTTGLKQIGTAADVAKVKTAGLSATIMTLGKSLVAIGGITALATAISGIRREVVDVEVAMSSLEGSLNNIGITAASEVANIGSYADSFERLGFSGSDAIKGMTTLVTATGSVEQAQKLMGISADYARKRQVPLSQAALIMSRATTGAARAFTQFGIKLDASLPKSQAIAKAFDELNAKIGGTAVRYTETFAGRMDVLRETFENFLEEAIAPLLPILTRMGQMFISAAMWIRQNSAALKVYGGILLVVIAYMKTLTLVTAAFAAINPFTWWILGLTALGVLFVTLWNKFAAFRNATATGLAVIISLVGFVVKGFADILNVLSRVPKLSALKGVAKEADIAAEKIEKVAKSVEDLQNKKIKPPKFPEIPGFTKAGDPTGIKANIGNDGKGAGTSGQNIQYVTVYASNTNDIAIKMSKAAKNGLPVGGR
jgi:hypothetical protein